MATRTDYEAGKSKAAPSGSFSTFLKQFGILFLAGILGVVALVPTAVPVVQELLATVPDAPELPLVAVVLISLINPVILLIVGIVRVFFLPLGWAFVLTLLREQRQVHPSGPQFVPNSRWRLPVVPWQECLLSLGTP